MTREARPDPAADPAADPGPPSGGGPLTLVATAAFGLEAVVVRELHGLGYRDTRVENGRIAFSGDPLAVCRSNLWLRSADRVLLRMGSFEARTFDELFEGTRALDWAAWLPADARFPVRARSVGSQLHAVPSCQAIVKKAVVEALRPVHGLATFPEDGVLHPVELTLHSDRAALYLDTTGEGLFRRGYRQEAGEAPLKETMAAGLVQLSYWNVRRPLLDPFCGSGTIPIEAALIGLDRAPGLGRTFASEGWTEIPAPLWSRAREEAADRALSDPVEIEGYDIDETVLGRARRNAERAGLSAVIRFDRKSPGEVEVRRRYGCVICNPPYGARLDRGPDPAALRREFAAFASSLTTWSLYVLTADREFLAALDRRVDRRRKLYNGGLECTYHQILGPRPPWIQQGRTGDTSG